MHPGKLFCAVLPILVAFSAQVLAQAVVPNVGTLRGYPYGGNAYVFLQGYYSTNDAGGGILTAAGQNGCEISVPHSSWQANSYTVVLNPNENVPQGIALGMPVSGTGIQAGTTVQAFFQPQNGNPGTITLSLETTASGTIATLSGDNGGTAFNDVNNYCFQRISQNYSQVEWGAHTNGSEDTFALQNWLNANQPHIAVPGNSLISAPLVCSNPNGWINYNGTIEGPPTATSEDSSIRPSFLITAATSFPEVANTAMVEMMIPNCSVSGTGLIGSATGSYDIVDMESRSDSVLNHSYLFGGYNGFNCNFHGASFNAQVYDSTILHSANDGLLIACPNGKFERNVIAGAAADGIYDKGTQSIVEGNVIEQNHGNGVNCNGGGQLGIVSNYFDNNGRGTSVPAGGFNIYVDGCQAVSIAGNQLHRSDPSAVAMRPDYDVEFATPGTAVTNFSYADSPTPQNKSVFGPNALAAIGPLQSSTPQNCLTRLVTSKVGAPAE